MRRRRPIALGLSGTGVATGTDFPLDVVSLVSAFELAEVSPDDPASTGGMDMADLRLVGVTTDYPAQKAQGKTLADSRIYFALVTQKPWATPEEIRFDVLIDTNRDGKDDYQVFTTADGAGTDVYVAQTCRLKEPACTLIPLNGPGPDTRDTVVLGTNVIVITVPALLAGLSETSTRFDYKVYTYTLDDDGQIDMSGDPHLRPGEAGAACSAAPATSAPPRRSRMYEDLPGHTITAQVDAAAMTLHGSQGLLLLHHHNLPGQRAQVLAVGDGACALTCWATAPTWTRPGMPTAFTATVSAPGCAAPTVTWELGDGSQAAEHDRPATPSPSQAPTPGVSHVQAGPSTCHQAGTIEVSDTPPRLPRRRLSGKHRRKLSESGVEGAVGSGSGRHDVASAAASASRGYGVLSRATSPAAADLQKENSRATESERTRPQLPLGPDPADRAPLSTLPTRPGISGWIPAGGRGGA